MATSKTHETRQKKAKDVLTDNLPFPFFVDHKKWYWTLLGFVNGFQFSTLTLFNLSNLYASLWFGLCNQPRGQYTKHTWQLIPYY